MCLQCVQLSYTAKNILTYYFPSYPPDNHQSSDAVYWPQTTGTIMAFITLHTQQDLLEQCTADIMKSTLLPNNNIQHTLFLRNS